ncbi:MAG: hypothetical protein PHD76_12035 [Methylacidiphilales bacterium]|nr:hypothetical protein [Candidatus Methylacidiphilales bacterium]
MSSGYSPKETLELMLGHLGLVFEIREEDRPTGPTLHVLTAEPNKLIGKNGKILEDLQYLLNRIITSGDEEIQRVTVDVENYRQQQYSGLFKQVQAEAEKVRATGEEVVLPPMNSFERRLVHNLFKDDPEIQTASSKEESRYKSITLRRKTA